jgi:hypothetical protein
LALLKLSHVILGTGPAVIKPLSLALDNYQRPQNFLATTTRQKIVHFAGVSQFHELHLIIPDFYERI